MGYRGLRIVQVWLLVALGACGTGDLDPIELGPHLLADMIAGRIVAGDIPDHGLTMDADAVFVVQIGDPDPDWGVLTSDHFADRSSEVVVTSLDALRALSRERGGERIAYLGVGVPTQVSSSRWRLRLGGDYVVPEPETMRRCCCTGGAVFELSDVSFEFVEWDVVICA